MSIEYVRMSNPEHIREALEGAEEYVQVPHAFIWDLSLKMSAKYLWIALSQLQEENGSVCVSTWDLAKIIGYSQLTVRKATQALEERGYLAVQRRVKAKHTYRLLLGGEPLEWPEAA
ncbi:helix-turn-helix domain-containing protein [Streptomyces sp. NBC_00151]|uniref:helix-turn-helix domain-containing protein n=1 Tax=Streptomyces sp. NBC_00151 TaxID=2975669 RepID=UPI002DD97B93|nr:helix-turn-helix domain-containing protein [Streptomyces sp. NBC_00151]WRZ41074.1 helix-turn-helix domain-containing protein [Streptomyces sp. NBC_00151]WRZ90018.1 helix-turn-helix domain-containing protein [Streptomyces sp. NBC_01007]